MDFLRETLPADLFDPVTLWSLGSTVAMVIVGYVLSRLVVDNTVSKARRFLFIWHVFDCLIHLCLEGSFLYHCFFSWMPLSSVSNPTALAPTAHNFLGHTDRAYGPQAGGNAPMAQLWMIYGKADKRWAGADLAVISLELLTVFIAGPLAAYIAYGIAKKKESVNVLMVVIAVMELYGGWITFCPEWLVMSYNLDVSKPMYLWVYLVFFNVLWVFIPLYACYVAVSDMNHAYAVRRRVTEAEKSK
ncbi:ebp domain-containing protein [Xylariaceae sp. FL0255]|nr:ebp domain-containing protein [Xylariaceae sp. FL0255]